jgi:sepiapterin reductase
MDTDMQTIIRAECKDSSLKKYFLEAKERNELIDPNVSAAKMVSLLDANTFKSGAHVDIHD